MDSKNLSKLAIAISSVSILLIFYILSNAPEKQPDLGKKLEAVKLEMQKLQYEYEHLSQELAELDASTRDVRVNYAIQKYDETVDFTTPNVQDIDEGFMLVDAEQEEHLTGIKFKGRIINAQSIAHNSAEFRLTVNGSSREFSINRISPGNSTSFSVYVPDLKASEARWAKIKYIGSSVHYRVR
ncbi:hypothetical protein [Alcanivorax sp.]|uniref:hypothetical protein n=1 Tax=Alcanivorax sp. TaxID=1872427 RepID=UPI0025B9AF9B|nr:hypothetical protein [Alcanivorax sp.]